MNILRGYKYRIYPNKYQEELIRKTFGCCRFVYNQTLAYRKELYETSKKTMSRFDCTNYMTRVLKSKYKWLKEVDKCALQNSIFNMNSAYQKFFKEHAGYPKFKNKKSNRMSYTTNCIYGGRPTIEVNFIENKIKLPKLKWVKAKFHRKFNGKIKQATISQVPSGKYFVSVLIEEEYESMKPTGNVIGIDLGIKDLVITSNGDKFDNIKTFNQYEKKLAKEQRKLVHKKKGSNNYNKQRIKVAKIYEKIHNIRLDYLNKISSKLISENQVIISENLSISNMMKNHNFAKIIGDCSWYELLRQLQYKADWNNRCYIKIDRFVPSSQMCSNCGYINNKVKNISIREWTCPNCGVIHDRDINAAINILNEGLRLLTEAS